MTHLGKAHAREKELQQQYDNPSEQDVQNAMRRVERHPAHGLARETYQELLAQGFKPGEAADGLSAMRSHLGDDWRGLAAEKQAAPMGRRKGRPRITAG